MTILGKKIKRTAEQSMFVGISLPQYLHRYLSLYTLAKRMSKTMIIRDKIEEWYKNKRIVESEEELVKELLFKIQQEWRARKSQYLDKETFLKMISNEIKNIDKKHRDFIMEQLRNEKDKN